MQMDYDSLTAGEMFGEFLGAVSGAVLAPGASEGDLQMTETPVHEAFDVSIYQREHMPQECQDLPVGLKELLNLPVKAGHGAETFVLARIVDGTAVEDITSSITGQILGNAFFIGKTMDMDVQEPVLRRRKAGAFPHKSVQNLSEIWVAPEGLGKELTQVLERIRDAFDEVGALLDPASESVRAKNLKRPEKDEST